jgi:hypothetical protein
MLLGKGLLQAKRWGEDVMRSDDRRRVEGTTISGSRATSCDTETSASGSRRGERYEWLEANDGECVSYRPLPRFNTITYDERRGFREKAERIPKLFDAQRGSKGRTRGCCRPRWIVRNGWVSSE